jgi:hypothetical protein
LDAALAAEKAKRNQAGKLLDAGAEKAAADAEAASQGRRRESLL